MSLTRSIKLAGGLFTEGVRVDGLPNPPPSLSSATSKQYVDGQITTKDTAIKAYVDGKDIAMKSYVNQGDMYLYVSTVNELQLTSADFSNPDGRLQIFEYGGIRDFTKKYHNVNSHAILSLAASPCVLKVKLRDLK